LFHPFFEVTKPELVENPFTLSTPESLIISQLRDLSRDAHDTPLVFCVVLLPLFEEGELCIWQIVMIDDEIWTLDANSETKDLL
jgi:hypothetical protein